MPLQAASSSSSSKKRKYPEQSEGVPESISKKLKKDEKDKSKKRDKKGKARQTASDTVEEGEFKVIGASVTLSIPPRFAMSPISGVNEMLDSLIMRYVPALRGVMLSHSNAQFLSQTAKIINECPFAICDVGFDATVWSPQVGTKLTGRINLCSPDHISLLIHQTFNVSIPRHHIPTDIWEFEYGPAENDPEFGPLAIQAEEKTDIQTPAMELDAPAGTAGADTAVDGEEAAGIWIHKTTGDRLGGKEGFLEFTVIGLKVANQMLSLVGSIQPDPFSPEHIPQPAVSAKAKATVETGIEEEEEGAPAEEVQVEEELSDDEDPFAALGKAREEATEVKQVRKDKESSKLREEKKRKKKEKKHKMDENDTANGITDGSAEKPPKKKRKGKPE